MDKELIKLRAILTDINKKMSAIRDDPKGAYLDVIALRSKAEFLNKLIEVEMHWETMLKEALPIHKAPNCC